MGVIFYKARYRFEVPFVMFLREFALSFLRPFPPMMGDGNEEDLYKVFSVVKGKGGYNAVTNGMLWNLVGEESGLGLNIGPSVKLVYYKYLSALEAWVKKVKENKVALECGSMRS